MAKKHKYEVHLKSVNATELFDDLSEALDFIREYITGCETPDNELGTCIPDLITIRCK